MVIGAVGVVAVVIGCLVGAQPEPPPPETDPTGTASTTTSSAPPTTPPSTAPGTDEPPEPTPETGLSLSPDSGPPGTTVVARQVIEDCGTYTLLWDDTKEVGSVEVADGEALVEFTVAAPVGPHSLSGTCGSGTVGTAQFTVTEGDDGPDTTGPATTVAPVMPVPETLEQCEHEAAEAEARLTYEPRRSMVVGETYEVQAALSLDELPPDITFEAPTTVSVLPDARCTVEAELTGPDFEVSPAEPIEQSFFGTRALVWQWDVRPERSGDDLELTLRIQANIFEGGRNVPGRTILSETVIDVAAAPVSIRQGVVDWLADVFGHPIVPVLIVPLVGGMIAFGRRRMSTAGAGAGPGPAVGPGPAGEEEDPDDVAADTPRHARPRSRWEFLRRWRRA